MYGDPVRSFRVRQISWLVDLSISTDERCRDDGEDPNPDCAALNQLSMQLTLHVKLNLSDSNLKRKV